MNKTTNRLTALIVTLIIMVSAIPSIAADDRTKTYPQKFYDVPRDHWAFEYIAELTDRGVISGYEDNSFRPEKTVSRAEFARIMVGAAGLPTDDDEVYYYDMKEHWSIPYVNAARYYLTAYSDKTYRPDQAAVREDVTMAMVKLKGYDISDVDFSYLAEFTDADSISDNIKTYVAVAVEKGLISGFEDHTFRGQSTLTRAEAATLLWKAFQYGSSNKVADIESSASVESRTGRSANSGENDSESTVKPTVKPSADEDESESTPTPKPTATPKPTPTPKPYVLDTVAVAECDGIMAMSDDCLYYYDEDEEAVFEYNTQKEKTTKLIDIDDIKLTREKELSDGDVIEETYKDFSIEALYYDEFHDKLLASGAFYAVTDSLSTYDNTDYYYSKVIDITDGEISSYCNDKLSSLDVIMDKNNIFANGYIVDYKSGKDMIKIDRYIPGMSQSSIGHLYGTMDGEIYNVLFFDSGMFTDKKYKSVIYKCDKSGESWGSINSITTAICGFHDDKLYCWDTESGQIFTVGADGRVSIFDVDTNKDVDIEDMRGTPDSSKFGTIITLYVNGDDDIYFYDSNAIRVLKKR